jgi:N-acetyl-gamma-glutamyl-phosphate reductase
MERLRVGVVGASGYSGSIAARLVATHPRLALAFATSDKWAGTAFETHLGVRLEAGAGAGGRFAPNAQALDLAKDCDAVLLATSAEVSMRLLPAFAELGKQVVDFSGAFRLEASAYPRWYGFEHTAPAWLSRVHYGIPELFGAPPRGGIVSNPGCYATAAILPLAALLREGLVEPAGIVVDAKSGVSGAGKRATEEYSFGEVDNDFRAYKLLGHQHTPEIARALGRVLTQAPADPQATRVTLTFTPHLLPIHRGLFATCYARPRPGATAARVAQCLADTYARAPFVHAVAPGEVMLKRVAGTNLCQVAATANDDVVIALGALDNLVKGAAGQAVQNLNAMNGWDEALGLDALQPFAA